jgi:hypothetical protein
MRKAAWTHISTRRHSIRQVFPFGHEAADFMLHGTVAYVFRDGRPATEVDWAARARLVRREETEMEMETGWKLASYQVYLVRFFLVFGCLRTFCIWMWDGGRGALLWADDDGLGYRGPADC